MSKITQNSVSKPQLTNYGGPVLNHPKFVNIFIGNFWSSQSGSRQKDYLNKFTDRIVQSPYTTVWQEYGGGKGKFLGSVTEGDPVRLKVSEPDIQRFVAANARNGKIKGLDSQTVFNVYLAPGTILTTKEGDSSKNGLGGYHGNFRDSTGKNRYFTVMAYADNGNGIDFNHNALDNITIAASHEMSESVTDPDVESGRLAWYDERYGEISDIPISLGTPLSRIFGRIEGFAVQKNWSNKKHSAVISE